MNPIFKFHSCHSFLKCLWNLNSLFAHNFIKVPLLQAYVTSKKFGVICLSESYLDLSVFSNDANLDLTDYDLVETLNLIQERVMFASTLRTLS